MEQIQKRKSDRAKRFPVLYFANALLFALALLLTISAESLGTVHGAEKRTVRVGFFPMDGYNEIKDDGTHAGMDVEYLEALCDYVNWKIEYME